MLELKAGKRYNRRDGGRTVTVKTLSYSIYGEEYVFADSIGTIHYTERGFSISKTSPTRHDLISEVTTDTPKRLSKAAEYVKSIQAPEHPRPEYDGFGWVTEDGNCNIEFANLDPRCALELADWIIDTFTGEEL